jgi:hypothetical protein
VIIGRAKPINSLALLDRIAEGAKPRQIAAEVGCAYSTLRRRISRHVQELGCATLEQAVAVHTANRIKAILPLALRGELERRRK